MGVSTRPSAHRHPLIATIIAVTAEEPLILGERIDALDERLKELFLAHPLSEILTTLPGMGPRLGAEFLVAAGDPAAFTTAGHLAYAGLVPMARDSGKRVGNHRRMSGGNKMLKRVFYQSAFASLRTYHSRTF